MNNLSGNSFINSMNTVRVNPTNAVIESITITLGLLRFRRRSRNSGDLIIESSLNQYLFKMTYRRVLNHLTREQVKTKAEAAFYERTQAALCEVDYGRFEELDRKIKEAMAALPDSYREAFVMHRFKELSYKEIAEVLDVSPQTVAYRIQQALKLLRVSLKDYLPMLVWLVG